jgi:hypothetical protein
MRTHNRWVWSWFWVLIALLAAVRGALAQGIDPRLQQVLDDWRKRQERTQNVRYVVRGEGVWSKGAWPNHPWDKSGRVRPPRDLVIQLGAVLVLDFAANRLRLETDEERYDEATDKLYPQRMVRVADAAGAKMYFPREKNTHPIEGKRENDAEVWIEKGYRGGDTLNIGYWPLVYAHGSVPWQGEHVGPGKLRVLPDPELLYFHGEAVYRDRPVWVIRTQAEKRAVASFDEFWVDKARDSAIVRYALVVGDHPQYEALIDYQETTHGWMPLRWTLTERDFRGRTKYLQRFRVEGLVLDQALGDADFEIDVRPGMLVDEFSVQKPKTGTIPLDSPERKHFRMREDGSLQALDPPVPSAAGSRLWWLLLAIPAAGAGWWTVRRRGRRLRGAPQ